MKVFKTYWSQQVPYWGAFDDYIIIASQQSKERFLFRPEEFNYLCLEIHEMWQAKKVGYIQIAKEWNECTGFNDLDEFPSIIEDIEASILVIERIKGTSQVEYTKLWEKDKAKLLQFLLRNKFDELKIWKE